MSDESLAQNHYAPPIDATPDEVPDDGRKDARSALLLGVAAVVTGVGTVGLMMVIDSSKPGVVGFGVAALAALLGCFRGIVSLVKTARSPLPASPGLTFAVVLAVLANGLMSFWGALMALMATVNFSRGRQLRRLGRVLLPPVHAGGAWAALPLSARLDAALGESFAMAPPARRALAAQWRENGRTEHASVAAFARLTLDLMALGAPPALVAAANRDALDEIRHAELCFSIARAIDGQSEGPAAFPEARRAHTLPANRTLALAALAVDSLVDGAMNEGLSARVVARLAKRCEVPEIRGVLKEIAADEGRHAAHGWDVVRWCLAEGGSPVADALRGAAHVLPRAMRSTLPTGAEEGAWERFGIHGRALEAEEHARTRTEVVCRVEQLTGPRAAAA